VILWWAVVNLVAILVFREFVYLVPSLASVGAFGFQRASGWIASRGTPIGTVGWLLLLAFCLASIPPTSRFQQVQLARAWGERGPGGGLSQPEELGRILTRDLPPGSLFLYGNAAELYPLSGRPPATPYLNAEAFRSTAPDAEQTRADLVAMLERAPPSVIVLPPDYDELELTLDSYPRAAVLAPGLLSTPPDQPQLRPELDGPCPHARLHDRAPLMLTRTSVGQRIHPGR